MSDKFKLFIAHCQGHPHFNDFVQHAKKMRPVVPQYTLDNVERWKLESGRQQGYDNALSMFKIYPGENHE